MSNNDHIISHWKLNSIVNRDAKFGETHRSVDLNQMAGGIKLSTKSRELHTNRSKYILEEPDIDAQNDFEEYS